MAAACVADYQYIEDEGRGSEPEIRRVRHSLRNDTCCMMRVRKYNRWLATTQEKTTHLLRILLLATRLAAGRGGGGDRRGKSREKDGSRRTVPGGA